MTNTTLSTQVSTKLNKTFYDRQLLESAKTRFVFTKYGQKRRIPRNNGKQVEFRRWELFDPKEAVCGLQEGVTPTGQELSQTSVTADISQYGAYVEVSDLLDMTGYDDVINDSVELLGEQLGTVVEWVTRDAISSGSNVIYAGGAQSRDEVDSSKPLTTTDIRRAVKSLKKAKARMFSDNGKAPHYICVCSPDAVYDLQNDNMWQEANKYASSEALYSGEIGRMFGVVFVESTECKVFEPMLVNSVAEGSTKSSIVLQNPLTAEQVKYIKSGGNIRLSGSENLAVDITSLEAGASTLTLTKELDTAPAAFTAVLSDDTSDSADPVHAALVFGKDAYGVIDIDGTDTIESIIKPCGSAGTSDPLNQRATIGAKVAGFTARILNELWLVRIEHGVTA
ncbi:MAG: N4-gp56 family major capsid protein [Clostridia bacterium]|nr:N4-gp56 family major capsid protein [Clostridia bacterium]